MKRKINGCAEMMKNLIKHIKEIYNTYFKPHCPACDGVMDSAYFNVKRDCMVYKCRDCGKEWI